MHGIALACGVAVPLAPPACAATVHEATSIVTIGVVQADPGLSFIISAT
jgi:hypothetical protein